MMTCTSDVICIVALGRKYGAETDLKELTDRLVRQLGTFTFGSFVPCLSWIDWICGLERQLEKTANDFDEILEKVVQDHEDGDGGKADFADVLLTLQRDKSVGFEVSRMSIKAIILVMERKKNKLEFTSNNVLVYNHCSCFGFQFSGCFCGWYRHVLHAFGMGNVRAVKSPRVSEKTSRRSKYH